MPGLFLYFKKSSNEYNTQNLNRVFQNPNQTYFFENFFISQIKQSSFGHSYFYHPKGVHVWVFGSFRKVNSNLSFAEDACLGYLKISSEYIKNLNGEFNLIIFDENKKTIIIANDRFGVRPWYIYENHNELCLSPDINLILRYTGHQPVLNKKIAYGFLTYNKMRLGNETLLMDIDVIPAASIYKINLQDHQMVHNNYWQFTYNDETSQQTYSLSKINDLVDCYQNAMNERVNTWADSKVGISLSGGLDSRTMIAALNRDNLQKISSHTFGLLESDEVKLAAEVAKTKNVKSYLYELNAPDYINYANDILDVTPELDLFVQAAQQKFLNQAKDNIDVLMTGIDLDVTLGGIYLEPEFLNAKNTDEIFQLIKKKNTIFGDDLLKNVLSENFRTENSEKTDDFVKDLLEDLPQENPGAKYDLFLNQYSMRRIIMLRYGQIRSVLETASPMYDYDFIDLIRNLPINERAKHASFIPFLEKLSPELSRIVYQRTMLPANAPRKFWKESEQIENLREQLYLKIWKETNGEINIPYRRYYTNFDEWLRIEPSWLNFTDKILNNSTAKLYEMDIVKPKEVNSLIQEHRLGIRSHRQRIIILISLELFLQKYFN